MADHPRWARFENILAKRPPERFRSLDNKSICAAIQKHFRDRPVATSLPLPPGLGKLPGFMHRFRLKLAAKPRDSPVAGHHEPHHFEHCRDFCNASLLLDHGPLLPDNSKITCSDTMLRVIDMRLSPEHVSVPLICPALFELFSAAPLEFESVCQLMAPTGSSRICPLTKISASFLFEALSSLLDLPWQTLRMIRCILMRPLQVART